MIKTYTLPNCQICEELKAYMRKNNINFQDINVETNPKALAKMTMEGIEKYPAVEINGVIYTDELSKLKKMVSV